MSRIAVGTALGLGGLLGAGWLGLQVPPSPYPSPSAGGNSLGTAALPADLPPPVRAYFRAALGEQVPVVNSAIVTGRGHLRLGGLSVPTRFRFTHAAGRAYRHDIQATVFGVSVFTVTETFIKGHARLALPFGVVEHEPKVDLAANLALWGESIWLPSVLATDPRVRWEPMDALTARLVVPFGAEEDSLTVRFDAATGLVRQMEALRFKGATDDIKTPWRIEPLGWQTFDGMRLPSSIALTWIDTATPVPWLVVTVDGVAYNVDTDHAFQSPPP